MVPASVLSKVFGKDSVGAPHLPQNGTVIIIFSNDCQVACRRMRQAQASAICRHLIRSLGLGVKLARPDFPAPSVRHRRSYPSTVPSHQSSPNGSTVISHWAAGIWSWLGTGSVPCSRLPQTIDRSLGLLTSWGPSKIVDCRWLMSRCRRHAQHIYNKIIPG